MSTVPVVMANQTIKNITVANTSEDNFLVLNQREGNTLVKSMYELEKKMYAIGNIVDKGKM